MPADAILSVRGVAKRYEGLLALAGIDFDVARGEVFGVIGPNGAGKTTLFSCLVGAVAPTSGAIAFRGERIEGLTNYAVVARGLVRTHQIVRPFREMTVEENVSVGAHFGAGRRRKEDAGRRVAEILEKTSLSRKAGALAGTLTIGELKRLEIARALATEPEVLCLDEVMGGVNPFPKARSGEEDLNAHHNPMQPFRRPSRRAEYQPKEPRRIPRSIPDRAFNELFAALTTNRDRALIAFYISAGARAWELLGVTRKLVAPEDQLIGVIRKGSRALQHLPASVDAFVWLKLYQREIRDLVPAGPDYPLWWTLRRPFRRLEYDAARMVFNKANAALGSNWTLHDLRHSAAKRMKVSGV